MTTTGPHTLQLPDNPHHHEWEWRLARFMEMLLPALMVATALGAFGHGPLSRAHAGEPGAPLWVEYDRIARFGASVRLLVHAQPGTGDVIELTLDRPLLEAFAIRNITPAPASTGLAADGVTYRFAARAPQTAPVIFELQPARRWRVHGHIRSPAAAVRVAQLILP